MRWLRTLDFRLGHGKLSRSRARGMHQDLIIIIIDNWTIKSLAESQSSYHVRIICLCSKLHYRLAFNISTQFFHSSVKFLQSTSTLPSLTASKNMLSTLILFLSTLAPPSIKERNNGVMLHGSSGSRLAPWLRVSMIAWRLLEMTAKCSGVRSYRSAFS